MIFFTVCAPQPIRKIGGQAGVAGRVREGAGSTAPYVMARWRGFTLDENQIILILNFLTKAV